MNAEKDVKIPRQIAHLSLMGCIESAPSLVPFRVLFTAGAKRKDVELGIKIAPRRSALVSPGKLAKFAV